MTSGEVLLFVAFAAVIVGGMAVVSDLPASILLIFAASIAGIVGGGVALGLALRRWEDRSTFRTLSRHAAPGTQNSAFEVSYRLWSARYGAPIYEVTTTCADAEWFTLHDLKQSAGLRLFKRLGLSHRLAIDDDGFNREIYVERNPEVGAVLFASAERREAARAIFRKGFFAIEYRNGLLSALHKGEVPDDVAVAVRPHLLVLARSASDVSHEPQWPAFADSRASASVGGRIIQAQNEPLIPAGLIVLDLVGLILLALGVAKQFKAIDVIPAQFRFQGYEVTFIVFGIVLMAPLFIRVITKVRERVRAEPGHKP